MSDPPKSSQSEAAGKTSLIAHCCEFAAHALPAEREFVDDLLQEWKLSRADTECELPVVEVAATCANAKLRDLGRVKLIWRELKAMEDDVATLVSLAESNTWLSGVIRGLLTLAREQPHVSPEDALALVSDEYNRFADQVDSAREIVTQHPDAISDELQILLTSDSAVAHKLMDILPEWMRERLLQPKLVPGRAARVERLPVEPEPEDHPAEDRDG
jgi:hypothetical protein